MFLSTELYTAIEEPQSGILEREAEMDEDAIMESMTYAQAIPLSGSSL